MHCNNTSIPSENSSRARVFVTTFTGTGVHVDLRYLPQPLGHLALFTTSSNGKHECRNIHRVYVTDLAPEAFPCSDREKSCARRDAYQEVDLFFSSFVHPTW